jgi:UPF0755 protein
MNDLVKIFLEIRDELISHWRGLEKANLKIKVSLGIGAFLIAALLLVMLLFQSANPLSQEQISIDIPSGATTYGIQSILEDNGVLRKNSGFTFFARLLGYSREIQAGKYRFSPSNTVIGIIVKLKRGEIYIPPPEKVWVTFPEGASIYVMGEILEKKGVIDYKKFQALVSEGITGELRANHWAIFKYIPTESLEGYLYPDTYWFFKGAKINTLEELMLKRFEAVVLPFWEKAKKDTKFSLHEVITLASIIEKEAQDPAERPLVSSVYHNRFKAHMYLSACPTIKYSLDRPTKKVYYEQLEVNSPYNTYKHKGLPPGPICNPGIESIKAAVYPAKTEYYYFVSKHDGSHVFSSTWKEHEAAKQKYSTPTQ